MVGVTTHHLGSIQGASPTHLLPYIGDGVRYTFALALTSS
jgi:hypothetical protein